MNHDFRSKSAFRRKEIDRDNQKAELSKRVIIRLLFDNWKSALTMSERATALSQVHKRHILWAVPTEYANLGGFVSTSQEAVVFETAVRGYSER